jgi:hypothetical protein
MKHVFISYSSRDLQIAAALRLRLLKAKVRVAWDKDFPGGTNIRHAISEQLSRVDKVIVLWSQNSVTSDYVLGEAEAARHKRKLLPIKIRPAPDDPPIDFRPYLTRDLTAWDQRLDNDGLTDLLRDLGVDTDTPEPTSPDDLQLPARVLDAPANSRSSPAKVVTLTGGVELAFLAIPGIAAVLLARDVLSHSQYAAITATRIPPTRHGDDPFVFRSAVGSLTALALLEQRIVGRDSDSRISVRLPSIEEWRGALTREEFAKPAKYAHFAKSDERIGSAARRNPRAAPLASNLYGFYDLLGNYPEVVTTDQGDHTYVGFLHKEQIAKLAPEEIRPRKVGSWTLRPVLAFDSVTEERDRGGTGKEAG